MSLEQRALLRHADRWRGTAEELLKEVERILERSFPAIPAPSLRTIRLWRTKGVMSASGTRSFTGRQLLEAVAVLNLQGRGWSLAAIGDLLPRLDSAAVANRLSGDSDWGEGGNASGSRHTRAANFVELAAVLLAQGALKLYDRVLPRREIVRQDDMLPTELHQAMCLIGRLYIEEGKPDRAGCVHDLLDRARLPLADWDLEAFRRDSFRFRDALLIDPDLRVPTQDALAVATSGGWGMDDIIESQLHARLRELVDRLGPTRNAAYTSVREFVARRSLASESEIRDWFEDRKISAIQGIVDDLYDHVPECWLISGRANRCAWCGTLLKPHPDVKRFPDGKCPLRQCSSKREPRAGERLDPSGLLVCRPQVLMYWTNPAIDELEVFDAAEKAGLDAELYPEGDRCDVSIGKDRVGIDVKCYTSPVSLAVRLNKGIGGLAGYRKRILAVPDSLIGRPGYLDILKTTLDDSSEASTVQIKGVGALTRSFREGNFDA
jgi:hypothetical protein